MKGRRPDPARVKLLKNNPGGRGVNFNEPKHGAIDERVPDDLTDPCARAEWSRVIGVLSRGHVQTTERPALIAYCQQWGRYSKLTREADEQPALIKGAHGGQVSNPIHARVDRAYYLFFKAAQEIGLTPATRSRIVVQLRDDEHAADEFTKYQKQRKRA